MGLETAARDEMSQFHMLSSWSQLGKSGTCSMTVFMSGIAMPSTV